MPHAKTLVLNQQEVALKIQRIAWEIYEKHLNVSTLYVVGIANSGFWLAQQVSKVLSSISEQEVVLVEMEINKRNPIHHSVNISMAEKDLTNATVVLIDDVLNSGKVLIYGAKHLLDFPLKSLTTAVLVDRNHKRYPVKADVKGLSLSTSMNEHVEVAIDGDFAEVYLY